MRTICLRLGGVILLVLALLLNLGLAPHVFAQSAPAAPASPSPAEAQVRAAAEHALVSRAQPGSPELTVANVHITGGWAALALAPAAAIPSGGQTALAVQQPDASWRLYFADDPAFAAAVNVAPAALLDPLAKAVALSEIPLATPAHAHAAASGYWLPWPAGESGRVTQNYATHGLGQIDFYFPSAQVLAAKAGDVVYIQDGHTAHGCDTTFSRYNNVVVVRHAANEYSFYVHIARGSVPQPLKDALAAHGSVHVDAGDLLAQEGNTGYTCGGDGTHLHLSTGASYSVYHDADSKDEDGDGDTSEQVWSAWTSTHQPVDFHEAAYDELANWPFERPIVSQNRKSPCAVGPIAGVVFYAATNCTGESQAFDAESGLVNLPSLGWNDRIRAIAVAPGWSARVYLHTDRLGASRCVDATLPDLGQAVFDPAATVQAANMDRAISSFELFHGDDCRPALGAVSAAPAMQQPALRLGEPYPLTVTFGLSGMADVRLAQWRQQWQPAAPSGAGSATVTQVDIPVLQAGAQAALFALPPDDLPQRWAAGQTALVLHSEFSGSDAWSRPVTVAFDTPVTIDACGDAADSNGAWNGDPAHAAPLAVGGVISAAICPLGDLDYYAFTGSAGQPVAASVVATATAAGMADPQVSIVDANGSPLAANDDAGSSRNALAAVVLPADGTYYLRVAASPAAGSRQPFTYTLQLQSGAGSLPPCTAAADAFEPDNTAAHAQPLATRGEPQARLLQFAGDADWVTVTVQAGVTYTATASAKEHSPVLDLYADPTQAALHSATGVTQTVLSWTPAASGAGFLRITPGGPGAVGCLGDYTLSVTAGDQTPPTASLRINGGAPIVNSAQVTVEVTAGDAGTGIDAWRVGTDDGLAGAAWQSAAPLPGALPAALPFTFTPGDGERRIFAQVRDAAGNLSPLLSATVTLDTKAPAAQLTAAPEVPLQGGAIGLEVDASPDVAGMRLRVAGGDWGPWQEYAPQAMLDLGGQSGALTVEVQVRDRAGNLSLPSALVLTHYPPAVFMPRLQR